MKFHISVKNFFKVSDALLDWDKLDTQLIAQVNRYYIQSVQNIGKIDQTRMPKLVCFNAARTIYEELAKQKLPELEADLLIRGLNKNDPNNATNVIYSNQKLHTNTTISHPEFAK